MSSSNGRYELGRLIRHYRTKNNLTQRELAERLGMESGQYISNCERGECAIAYDVIGKLVILLDIPERKISTIIFRIKKDEISKKMAEGKLIAMNALK